MGFRVFFCAFLKFRIVSYTEKPRESARISGVHSSLLSFNYFRVTFAPSASSLALMSSALFQDLRSTVNYVLSLFQTKTGSFTYNLDNFNLVRANLGQLYVELGLLLSCLACASCCCNYNACCCGYAKLFLTCLYRSALIRITL